MMLLRAKKATSLRKMWAGSCTTVSSTEMSYSRGQLSTTCCLTPSMAVTLLMTCSAELMDSRVRLG